jgi:hypothetical protein
MGEDLETIQTGRRPIPTRPKRRPTTVGVLVVAWVAVQLVSLAIWADVRSPNKGRNPEAGASPAPEGQGPCLQAEHDWQTASADALPPKDAALNSPTTAELPAIETELQNRYGVLYDVHVEKKPWRVWSRDGKGVVQIEEASIPVLVARISDVWRCPDAPITVPGSATPVVFLWTDSVLVPDVVGLQVRTASAALYGVGLHPWVEGASQSDTAKVSAQAPPPGTTLQRRLGVRLNAVAAPGN